MKIPREKTDTDRAYNEKRRTGRPTGRPEKVVYDKDRHPNIVRKFLFDNPNATLPDLEQELGICTKQLFKWKKIHADFKQALREGRAPALARLFRSGMDAACGFYYTEEAVVKGEGVREVRRYVPPNPVIWSLLASTYLGVTRREQLEHSGPGGGPMELKVDYSSVSEEAARSLLQKLDKIAEEAEAEN